MILTLLGLIPGLSTLLQGILNAWFNAKVAITTAKIGGDTAVATEIVRAAAKEGETRVNLLTALASSQILLAIVVGFALPFIIYEWKVVAYDIVWMGGTTSTDPIRGNVADWGTTIITCLFGSGTALTLGHMWFNRKDQ